MSLLLAPIYAQASAPAAGAVVATDNFTVDGTYWAYFIIANDGFVYGRRSYVGAGTMMSDWIAPQSGMDLYECMASDTLGGRIDGTFNEWLDLAQSWTWGISGNRFALSEDVEFTLQIRRKSDLVVVGNYTIDLSLANGGLL